MAMRTFGDDADFLSRHTDLVVLNSCRPALVAVAPGFQGRVMTSTTGGREGPSFGWVNNDFIESGRRGTAFDNYGGEDRFWLGPEAGQFGLWFQAGKAAGMDNFRTPEGLNSGQFVVTSRGRGSVALAASFDVTNYSGTLFEVAVKRVIDVLPRERMAAHLAVTCPGGISYVGFQSTNILANVGPKPWTRAAGLLSVWTLGMFNPLPRGLVIVPFVAGTEKDMGPMPSSDYFSQVPPERFWLAANLLFFRCDGQFRSKLGVSNRRAQRVLGSYDPDGGTLTIVQFNLPSGAAGLSYVNSRWEMPQKNPYDGDAVNSYNDGPAKPGGPSLGGFYELETSSPAAELAPDESVTHVHRTFHFTGPLDKLNSIARQVLGVDLTTVKFPEK